MSKSPKNLGVKSEYNGKKFVVVGFCHSPRYFIYYVEESDGERYYYNSAKVTKSGSMRTGKFFNYQEALQVANNYLKGVVGRFNYHLHTIEKNYHDVLLSRSN